MPLDSPSRRPRVFRSRHTSAQFKQLLGDLQASRDILRMIVDGLDDGLALLNQQGIVMMANQALATFYNTTPATLFGRPWRSVCALTLPLVEQTLLDGQPSNARLRFTGPNERPLVLDARAFPIADATARPPQVVLHLTNVSERVQLEHLAVTNERLAASGRLAAIVAHEVNTPLQSIQNFLYLAEEDPAERSTYMGCIHDELDRVSSLIRRLLDLHRPGDGTRKPLDVTVLIERTLTLVSGTLQRQRIKVVRDMAASLPLVRGRQDDLMQVLLNLFLNAVDAMPRGGTLTIGVTSNGPTLLLPGQVVRISNSHPRPHAPAQLDLAPSLVITIADTGEGIPRELHERVFELFFTTKNEGSGLGLAISRQIIEQHEGRITVQSHPGAGTIFQIALPVVAP